MSSMTICAIPSLMIRGKPSPEYSIRSGIGISEKAVPFRGSQSTRRRPLLPEISIRILPPASDAGEVPEFPAESAACLSEKHRKPKLLAALPQNSPPIISRRPAPPRRGTASNPTCSARSSCIFIIFAAVSARSSAGTGVLTIAVRLPAGSAIMSLNSILSLSLSCRSASVQKLPKRNRISKPFLSGL